MYNQITANKAKSFALIFLFIVFIVVLGYVVSMYYGYGYSGVIAAGVFSSVSAVSGYYFSDKIALATSGAKAVEKKDQPQLYNIVENLSIASGTPMPKLYVINDPAPNAFATGRDPKHASVAVTTGLLQIMDKAELEGVLAHELSHVRNYDIRLMTLVVVFVGTITLLSDWFMRSLFFGRGGDRKGNQLHAVLMIVAIVLAILSPLIATLIKLAVSRKREYLADASGALLTRYPEGLARALEKIAASSQQMRTANHATAHMFFDNPFKSQRFASLFATHPPIDERIRILRGMIG